MAGAFVVRPFAIRYVGPLSMAPNQTQPLITCIVPVFNGELYLREALESIFQQTYGGRCEVIVVDDGSTDSTPEVLRSFGDRLRSVRQPNSGPAAARNRGLALATAPFIAFLDADDLWDPRKSELQMACLVARPELDACFGYALNFWIPELAAEAAKFSEHRIARPLPAYLPSAMLVRREVFERVGEFDPSLEHGHSMEWVLRAAECGVVWEMLPDIVYRRRLHYSNRSRVLQNDSRDEFLVLIKAHLDRQRRRRQTSGEV